MSVSKRKKRKASKKRVTLHLYVYPEVRARLARSSIRHNMSISAFVNQVLVKYYIKEGELP